MGALTLRSPPQWKEAPGGLQSGAWLGMCAPGSLPGTQCPTLKGSKGQSPLGVRLTALPAQDAGQERS